MGNSMIKIEPVMDADIVPGIQAAGIKLGISFDYFKKSTEHIYKPTKEECDVLSTHNLWFFFHRDEMTIGGIHINEIYCYWDNNIVLEFSGDESILTGIHVMSKYSGYLLKKLKIGDRLDRPFLAKYAVAFFSISRSSCAIFNSRFKRLFSSITAINSESNCLVPLSLP